MKKLYQFLSLFILIFSCSLTQIAQTQEEETHFRKSRWGMSKEEVLKLEREKNLREIEQIGLTIVIYRSDVDSIPSLIAYVFAENKLVRAKYSFIHIHTNKKLYISDFEKMKKNLTDKFGKPKYDRQNWLNNLYKDNPDDWGQAISDEHLRYSAEWEDKETKIIIELKGRNQKINLTVEYNSVKLADLEKRVKDDALKEIR